MTQIHFSTKLMKFAVEQQGGLEKFTKAYNKARRQDGKKPVQVASIKRYCNGGQKYESGVPAHLKRFLTTIAVNNTFA